MSVPSPIYLHFWFDDIDTLDVDVMVYEDTYSLSHPLLDDIEIDVGFPSSCDVTLRAWVKHPTSMADCYRDILPSLKYHFWRARVANCHAAPDLLTLSPTRIEASF